jgi:hypothetical protein
MAKILKALIGICAIFLIATVISAQNTTTGRTEKERQEVQVRNEEATSSIQERLKNAREFLEQKRLEIQNKIQAQKEILAKRLAKISEQKRKIVERIYDRINNLNKRITDHYLDVLEKLAKILEKIESRIAKFKSQGAETSEVEKCVQNAKLKIEKAKETVLVQAQKVYSAPQITTEKNLKLNVGVIRKKFYNDLKLVEKSVKDARSAVQNCAILLGKVAETKEKPATTTPATTTPATTTPTTPTLP